MKAIRTLFLLTMALRLSAASMSAEDRQHLMVHLQMTEQWLTDEVRGLSPAQLNFRSAPDRWSVRECVSHLAVAEPDYWRDFMKAVKATPSGTKSSATDADILWYGIDRVVHTKTGGGHEKVERYPELAPALADFKKLRATLRSTMCAPPATIYAATPLVNRNPSTAGSGCWRSPPTHNGTFCRSVRSKPTRIFRETKSDHAAN